MKFWHRISRFFCLICFIQIICTLYFILKIYISYVTRPDRLKDRYLNVHERVRKGNAVAPAIFNWRIFDNYYADENEHNSNKEMRYVGLGPELSYESLNVPYQMDGNEDHSKNHIYELYSSLQLQKKQINEKLLKDKIKPNSIARGYFSEIESQQVKVEIWGKAAIASYLWEHILGGNKQVDPQNPSIYSSSIKEDGIIFTYKEGPGLRLEIVSISSKFLVLVLNGRTDERVLEVKKWLEKIRTLIPKPKVLLVILGNEKCYNNWLWDYVLSNGILSGVFITYDDTTINDKNIIQWPLGVATYRRFPRFTYADINPSMHNRKYICSLQATNYANSSRSLLFSLMKSSILAREYCVIKERKEWWSKETLESSLNYTNTLLESDLALCPSGFNTETYRVFEALSAGTIPVIEDVPSSGECDRRTGWRLLKKYNPPVIWVDNWNEIDELLKSEIRMPFSEKIQRRHNVVIWYNNFKSKMKEMFIAYIKKMIYIKE